MLTACDVKLKETPLYCSLYISSIVSHRQCSWMANNYMASFSKTQIRVFMDVCIVDAYSVNKDYDATP